MQSRAFMRAVLSPNGHKCLLAIRGGQRKQLFFDTIDDLLSAAQRSDSRGADAYFALATFETDASRKTDNALEMKSFFLDLDCGDDPKKFRSQEDAISALSAFRRAIGLPAPILVSSGYGVHAYWPLTAPVPAKAWVKVATQFKAICEAKKLKIDPAVPADRARVLRVPGTHNHKHGDAEPVRVVSVSEEKISFEEFAEIIGATVPEFELQPTDEMRAVAAQTTGAVLEGMDLGYRYSFKQIIQRTKNGSGCNQIRHAYRNQETLEEPLWRAALSIAGLCEDGAKAAHAISRGHPGYSYAATERKVEEIKGPYSCAKFKMLNPEGCKNCPVAKKVNNPILLGRYIPEREADEDTIETERPDDVDPLIGETDKWTGVVLAPGTTLSIPQYPEPFFNGPNNAICIKKRDDDGEEYTHFVYRDPLYVVQRTRDPEPGEMAIVRLHLPRDGVREFIVPLSAITSREEFRKHISSNGVTAYGESLGLLMTYMVTWIEKLQREACSLQSRRQFGWVGERGKKSFVLGPREFHPDGSVTHNPASSSTVGLIPAFEPLGTVEDWVDLANFFNRDGQEVYQFVVCLELGTPLMEMTNWHGVTINIFGESGMGKTTAATIGLAAWAQPEKLMLRTDDTINSAGNRLEVLKNLPSVHDEVTNTAPDKLSEFVYRVSNGAQKNRMSGSSNSERFRGETWNLVHVMTSNSSVIDKIAAIKDNCSAETYRMFEFSAARYQIRDKNLTDKLVENLQNAAGMAGPVFLSYVVQHQDEVRELMLSVQSKLNKRLKFQQAERFWAASVTTAVTALLIAKKLGLLAYDQHKLLKWMEGMLIEHRERVTESVATPEQVITRYMMDHQDTMLSIVSTVDMRGNKRDLADDEMVDPDKSPRAKFSIRYESDRNMAYLDTKALRKWCVDRQLAYAPLVQYLRNNLAAKTVKKRMGAGTPYYKMPPISVLEVNLNLSDTLRDVVGGGEDTDRSDE